VPSREQIDSIEKRLGVGAGLRSATDPFDGNGKNLIERNLRWAAMALGRTLRASDSSNRILSLQVRRLNEIAGR